MSFSKFDQLIYWVEESGESEAVVLKEVVALFPEFDVHSDKFNDQYITPYIMEKYVKARALGIPLIEVANSMHMSATLLYQIYHGERVSLERLVGFAKAETFSEAEKKVDHLAAIETAALAKSSITFLERVHSKDYAERKQIDINQGFGTEKDGNTWTVNVVKVDNKSKTRDSEELGS